MPIHALGHVSCFLRVWVPNILVCYLGYGLRDKHHVDARNNRAQKRLCALMETPSLASQVKMPSGDGSGSLRHVEISARAIQVEYRCS